VVVFGPGFGPVILNQPMIEISLAALKACRPVTPVAE
jgi:hypothetical protein